MFLSSTTLPSAEKACSSSSSGVNGFVSFVSTPSSSPPAPFSTSSGVGSPSVGELRFCCGGVFFLFPFSASSSGVLGWGVSRRWIASSAIAAALRIPLRYTLTREVDMFRTLLWPSAADFIEFAVTFPDSASVMIVSNNPIIAIL